MPAPKFTTAKEYAKYLLVLVVDHDGDGRPVGLSYNEILRRIYVKFPVITYRGPHFGKAIKLTMKELRNISYLYQHDDRSVRYPIRPRASKKRKRRKTGTIIRRRAASGCAATGSASST